MTLKTKRVYDAPATSDGTRILVDRLWPRGLSKENAHLDLWLKEIGPSDDLRKWFAHDPVKWPEFQQRYFAELHDKLELVAQITQAAQQGSVTLLFAASDVEHNNAVALKAFIEIQQSQ